MPAWSRNASTVVPLGLVVACLVGVMGCGGGAPSEKTAEAMMEKAMEHAGGGDADVDIDEGKVRIKSEDGESELSFDETEWPDDLPDGVPDFEMGKVRGVNRFVREGKNGWNVVLEEIQKEAFPKYAKRLEKEGWAIRSRATTGKGGMLQATKGDLVMLGMYNEAEGQGTISISMQ